MLVYPVVLRFTWQTYLPPAVSFLALRFFPIRLPMERPIFFMASTWLPLFGDLMAFFDGLSTLGFFAGRSGVAESSSADDGRFLRLA